MTNADYYTTLHLSPGATPEEMKRAYRALVKRYHPDYVPEKYKQLATEKLRQVIVAYRALTAEENTQAVIKTPAMRRRTAIRPRKPVAYRKPQNDNAAQRFIRTGLSNLSEILWPIAPKQKDNHV